MKKLLYLLPCLFLLTACPVGLDYAPATPGTEAVDSRLEGTWTFEAKNEDDDPEVVQVKFTKKDKYSYNATVVERGGVYALDTDNLTMYETTIDGIHILYLIPDDENKYYLYQYKFTDNKTLVVADIPLLDGGIDAVTSSEALRTQIASSSKMDGFYGSPLTYKKQ